MKTCPNCGSKMDQDVNFCTNCGTDLRNVPLDSEAEKVEISQTTSESPESVQPERQGKEVKGENSKTTKEQINSDQTTRQTVTQEPSMFKVHATNMWQWFVNSWKHPFEEQQAEKWYGWVTLLVENILFILGLYICINKYAQDQLGNSDMGEAAQNIVSNFSTSLLFELFLYLIITAAALIAVAYYAYKFVYGTTEQIFDFINRIVSCSNLSAVLYVLSFICLIIGSEDMLKVGIPLAGIAMAIFSLAVYTVVIGNSQPVVHDKFYGLLIVVVVQIIVMAILGQIFGNAVYNQIQDLIHSTTNGMF